MSLTPEEINKIAHLARLTLTESEMVLFTPQLSKILQFIEHLNQCDTSQTSPLAHPLDISQRLRTDKVTESNERDKFQRLAPQTEAGLYLVPKVIEEA